MRQVRKNANELRMKSMVKRITFQAQPYQKPGNGSDLDIFYILSQKTIAMTGNMLSLIGSAVAGRPKKRKVTLHQEIAKYMGTCPPCLVT